MISSDLLSRQSYVNLLSSIIENQLDNPSGYSFAIDGEWGAGKTWILGVLENQLMVQNENAYLIFHYNAWENDYYEEPLIAILSVMIEKLNEVITQKSIYESTVDELLKESLNDLKLLVCGIVQEVTKIDLEKSINNKKGFLKRIKEGTKISKKEIDEFIPIQQKLKIVRENILRISNGVKIILIVDELDRCLPEYAIKVLERLHHICNGLPIIQILAINKRNLSDSIAKVFGKNYSVKNNIEDWNEHFADIYLQKFVDVILPLSNGKLEKQLYVLNGLEKMFEPYIRDDINEEGIRVDDNYLATFISFMFSDIDRRKQEKIISLISMCHKLTIATFGEIEYPTYAILIYEVISCICRYIFHKRHTCRLIIDNQYYQLKFFQDAPSLNTPQEESNKLLNAKISDIFNAPVHYNTNTNPPERYAFEITNTKTYLMAFFYKQEIESYDPVINGIWKGIEQDKLFCNL